MKKISLNFIACIILSVFITGCYHNAPPQRTSLVPDYYPEKNSLNSTTYTDSETGAEKTVYDLNGRWKVWLGYADAVAIVQVGDRFEGRTMVGGGCCSHEYDANRLMIRGRVDGNLIHCEKRTADNEWHKSVTEISKGGEEFYCLGFPVRRFEKLGPIEAYYPLTEK